MTTIEKKPVLNGIIKKELSTKGKKIIENLKEAQEVMKNLSLRVKIEHPVR